MLIMLMSLSLFVSAVIEVFPAMEAGGGIEFLLPKKYSKVLEVVEVNNGSHLKAVTTTNIPVFVRPLQKAIESQVG